jgi:hypothetical protein
MPGKRLMGRAPLISLGQADLLPASETTIQRVVVILANGDRKIVYVWTWFPVPGYFVQTKKLSIINGSDLVRLSLEIDPSRNPEPIDGVVSKVSLFLSIRSILMKVDTPMCFDVGARRLVRVKVELLNLTSGLRRNW